MNVEERFVQAVWIGVELILFILTVLPARIHSFIFSRNPVSVLKRELQNAKTAEEWQEIGLKIDESLGYDNWRLQPESGEYDYKLMAERLEHLTMARLDNNVLELARLLRSSLVRNLGSVSNETLYSRAYGGTKLLIEDYITEVILDLESLAFFPTNAANRTTVESRHMWFKDSRRMFGRSALILEGRSFFGAFHLGVVKALYEQGYLPCVIIGADTGTIFASLIGILTNEELEDFLNKGIYEIPFSSNNSDSGHRGSSLYKGIWSSGDLINKKGLLEYLRGELEDMTFDEAFTRSGRILNVVVYAIEQTSPMVLNYLTTPNVVIWSACEASCCSIYSNERPHILCKDEKGTIQIWKNASKEYTWCLESEAKFFTRQSPYVRVSQLFHVNHFIVSRAHSYLAPFFLSEQHRHGKRGAQLKLVRLVALELRHKFTQLDVVGLLPYWLRRWLINQDLPGMEVTLVPEFSFQDVVKLFEPFSSKTVDYFCQKGQTEVWSALPLLRTRCALEVTLNRLFDAITASEDRTS